MSRNCIATKSDFLGLNIGYLHSVYKIRKKVCNFTIQCVLIVCEIFKKVKLFSDFEKIFSVLSWLLLKRHTYFSQ